LAGSILISGDVIALGLPEDEEAVVIAQRSTAHGQHVQGVASGRLEQIRGNIGPTVLVQIRDTIGLILDVTA